MPDAAIVAALSAGLPRGIGLGWADPRLDYPDTGAAAPPKAVEKRLREFRAGRFAARSAIVAAGLIDAPIPIGLDRAPIWPQGIIGSISHCHGLCLAIAAPAQIAQGLGLDVENLAPLPRDLWPTILTNSEITEVGTNGLLAQRIFLAKEASYKAQYPQSKTLFDFHTLQVTLNGEKFTARFTRAIAPFQTTTEIHGHFVQDSAFIAAFARL